MLFGYVQGNSSYEIKNDDENPVLDCDYYYGTNEDGARHTGWLQYTDALTDRDNDEDYYWFYFNTSNGKKVTGEKSINGKKYSFDYQGVMNFKWTQSTTGEATTTKWFGQLEDGSLAKNKWIWNKPYADVTDSENQKDYADETPRWFRTDASGNLVTSMTKKINSKWYVFDQDGVMLTGLVALYDRVSDKPTNAVSGSYAYKQFDMDEVTENELYDYNFGTALHYFSEDEEKDGSMKTGTMKIELADDTHTFCFTKNTGAAKHGYDSSSKKVYDNGILQDGGDDKYKVVKNPDAKDGQSDWYLVGSTGSVVTSVNKYKDANDKYYVLIKDGSQYKVYSTYDEDIAKAAVKAKSVAGLNVTDECVE